MAGIYDVEPPLLGLEIGVLLTFAGKECVASGSLGAADPIPRAACDDSDSAASLLAGSDQVRIHAQGFRDSPEQLRARYVSVGPNADRHSFHLPPLTAYLQAKL